MADDASAPQQAGSGRLLWHCRRGLLELDLILQRFVDTRLEKLGDIQRAELFELLQYDDITLLAIVSGREECEETRLKGVVDLLRAS
ncbi:MAG: succinate dehydrogenase assembly factor 2 [Gammaproteobacteria bacterium]|jgi:antitoxin CptB|nr:succinate dehydrogenase assembly factor 2 [Gammaproteobacteria bacterium]MBU0773360.1 succinate dehydrogenase assembly factor 2 [Gammaproteobacteria bacterium]MBU0855993.1 succinate dehydrogenase assembly factor 2 [Gammaproteobacteria bacterium]MBU1846672.1 succinate dehydrogenase assembly factor 2 [Gammaproteobacteria bacterium]